MEIKQCALCGGNILEYRFVYSPRIYNDSNGDPVPVKCIGKEVHEKRCIMCGYGEVYTKKELKNGK